MAAVVGSALVALPIDQRYSQVLSDLVRVGTIGSELIQAAQTVPLDVAGVVGSVVSLIPQITASGASS